VRWTSEAVSSARAPSSAERLTSTESSSALRAEPSSSCGSMPRARTTALALPLNSRMGRRRTELKMRWKPTTSFAVRSGWAIAMFLGTSSPKIIVMPVARTRASATEAERAATSPTPASTSGGPTRAAIAGSARKPMPRLVTVIPSCAPESCVERVFMPCRTPPARLSPLSAAASTSLRLTVIRENSAATKQPQASTSTSPIASETRGPIRSMDGSPRGK
jgi:hypothetical protein